MLRWAREIPARFRKLSPTKTPTRLTNNSRKIEEKTDTDLIHEVLPTLDSREQEILRSRFGLGGDKEQTLEEIGEKFGVTRERIRQIQELALSKLRRKIDKLEMSVVE
jgi:RNA polymerase primary sigma factor